jgi:hypothetical protein
MNAPTFTDRALAGEYGPLDDSNEAALFAAYETAYCEAYKTAPGENLTASLSARLGLPTWLRSMVQRHTIVPMLQHLRERRELEAQLASLREAEKRNATVLGMARAIVEVVANADYIERYGQDKIYADTIKTDGFDFGGAKALYLIDAAKQAARAMGVEVES